MVPTAVSGIHFVASVVCMCSAAAGTFDATSVLVLLDIHCSLAVGATTAAVVGLDATFSASAAGAAIFSVSMVAGAVAGAVAAGVAMWVLSAAVISTPLVCTVQTLPYPSVLSLSILVQPLFHLATFYATRACMHLCKCGRHTF